jgi:hypothetical protein
MQSESLLFSPDGLLVINQHNTVLLSNDTVKAVMNFESGTHEELSKLISDVRLEDG